MINGNTCQSQGSWVSLAIDQAADVVDAINKLKDYAGCNDIYKSLTNSKVLEDLTSAKSSNSGDSGRGDDQSIYSINRQMQALKEYMNPKSSTGSLLPAEYKQMVNYVVFRKSMAAAEETQARDHFGTLSSSDKAHVQLISEDLKQFMQNSKRVAKISMRVAGSLFADINKTKLCFDSHPSTGAIVFTALASTAAAFTTGGEISELGDFLSQLMYFQREAKYLDAIRLVDLEKFRTRVSCLIEATQESYCALQDAQNGISFMQGIENNDLTPEQIRQSTESYDPKDNPLRGILLLVRDMPVLSQWMQRILFGVDPKLIVEADMKNGYWEAILSFIKTLNKLPAEFRDNKQIYITSTQGASIQVKAGQLKRIIDTLTATLQGGGGGFGAPGGGSAVNFFKNSINPDTISFFLIGMDNPPPDFNPDYKNFGTFWPLWQTEGSHGLNNPDALLNEVERRMNMLIDSASGLVSNFFTERIIVDPQNLVAEGTAGPNISPLKAMMNTRSYLSALIIKLQKGMEDPQIKNNEGTLQAYKVNIPMFQDTILRLNMMIEAIKSLGNVKIDIKTMGKKEILETMTTAKEALNNLYESANMLVSRDTFISTRFRSAVRMDVSDTLWRMQKLNKNQKEMLQVQGKDVIQKLTMFFSQDPVLTGLDISRANSIIVKTLTGMNNIFAQTLYDQIVDVNCRLFGNNGGNNWCIKNRTNYPYFGTALQQLMAKVDVTQLPNELYSIGFVFQKPTSSSKPDFDLRGTLCLQSLGMEDWQMPYFEAICKGATIVSPYVLAMGGKDKFGLNGNYDQILASIKKMKSEQKEHYLEDSKFAGTCALRSYIRRNHIYQMYVEYYQDGQDYTQAVAPVQTPAIPAPGVVAPVQ